MYLTQLCVQHPIVCAVAVLLLLVLAGVLIWVVVDRMTNGGKVKNLSVGYTAGAINTANICAPTGSWTLGWTAPTNGCDNGCTYDICSGSPATSTNFIENVSSPTWSWAYAKNAYNWAFAQANTVYVAANNGSAGDGPQQACTFDAGSGPTTFTPVSLASGSTILQNGVLTQIVPASPLTLTVGVADCSGGIYAGATGLTMGTNDNESANLILPSAYPSGVVATGTIGDPPLPISWTISGIELGTEANQVVYTLEASTGDYFQNGNGINITFQYTNPFYVALGANTIGGAIATSWNAPNAPGAIGNLTIGYSA